MEMVQHLHEKHDTFSFGEPARALFGTWSERQTRQEKGFAGEQDVIRMIELCIFDCPPSANSLRRKYRSPFVYRNLRDSWGWSLAAAASPNERHFLQHIPHMARRVRVVISLQHPKLYDRDNLWASVKPILDSMVNLRWLPDDSEEHIDLQVTQTKGQPHKTILRIELL